MVDTSETLKKHGQLENPLVWEDLEKYIYAVLVKANVMMGQLGTYGTGMFNVVLDVDALKNVDDVPTKKRKNIDSMFGTLEDDNDICSKNYIEIKNNVAAIKRRDTGMYNDDEVVIPLESVMVLPSAG